MYTLCLTHWIVRRDSIESILSDYDDLNQLWEECLEKFLQLDIKGRVIGVQSQMSRFSVLFGLHINFEDHRQFEQNLAE